jgi:hypothetical protein
MPVPHASRVGACRIATLCGCATGAARPAVRFAHSSGASHTSVAAQLKCERRWWPCGPRRAAAERVTANCGVTGRPCGRLAEATGAGCMGHLCGMQGRACGRLAEAQGPYVVGAVVWATASHLHISSGAYPLRRVARAGSCVGACVTSAPAARAHDAQPAGRATRRGGVHARLPTAPLHRASSAYPISRVARASSPSREAKQTQTCAHVVADSDWKLRRRLRHLRTCGPRTRRATRRPSYATRRSA